MSESLLTADLPSSIAYQVYSFVLPRGVIKLAPVAKTLRLAKSVAISMN